ncbi:hypothetical protein [Pseudomonas sp. NFACC45]|uniref:hypothetical protein n=1 Tax=Pseudomonas sp. NFACC45 TaxID=1566201 RepID=UPI0008DF13CF|nr:hypothetical protein [Pseudomonas sp. NFACC45]SFG76855.1 hypothetical protein SAMN03159297_01217 [Pseudomonas sp. NFACC45]
MELLLETVALYSLKLAYETEGHRPILRDDPLMGGCDREVFGLLVRRGDVAGIQVKVSHCLDLALEAESHNYWLNPWFICNSRSFLFPLRSCPSLPTSLG